MVFKAESARTEPCWFDEASQFIQVIALLGIPAAGSVAVLQVVQIPRFIYGQANPFLFAAEVGSLIAVLVLVLALRACLRRPSAPCGSYRNVLDFLAISHWSLSVKTALAGLLVLPPAWYIHADFWFVNLIRMMGWRSLHSSDVQAHLDGIAVTIQLALIGGVPFLFALHMLTRWKPKSRVLPWVLVPALFVGTAFAIVLLVFMAH